METALNNVSSAPSEVFGRPTTTDKMVEAFAQAYVATGQWNAAYRRCYDCSGMKASVVYNAAYALSHHPGIIKRIHELREAAAVRAVVSLAEALKAQHEIATANPADVVRVSEHNCRHCHGIDGGYQWFDQDEYAIACATELDDAVAAKRVPKVPRDTGGYGFTHHRPPNPECEHCKGAGRPVVHIADTRELSGGAARLVKSIKQDRFGAITVELHDTQAAWDKIIRMLGGFNDKLAITAPSKPAELPADIPKEKAAEAYLTLVR